MKQRIYSVFFIFLLSSCATPTNNFMGESARIENFPVSLRFFFGLASLEELHYTTNHNTDKAQMIIDSFLNKNDWKKIQTTITQNKAHKTNYEAYSLASDIIKARLPYFRANDFYGDELTRKKYIRTQRYIDWSQEPWYSEIDSKESNIHCTKYSSPSITATYRQSVNKFQDILYICITNSKHRNSILIIPEIYHYIDEKYQKPIGNVGYAWFPWLDFSRNVNFIRNLNETLKTTSPDDENREHFSKSSQKVPVKKSTGSGFFVTSDGYLLTNYHVIDGCNKVKMDNEELDVITYDEYNDIALLKSNKTHENSLSIDIREPYLNEKVTVYGYPLVSLLGDNLSATSGSVSSLTGIKGDITQFTITAPIQPGNSGGPILSSDGALLGIVTATLNNTALGISTQNVNFGIRSQLVKNLLIANKIPLIAFKGGVEFDPEKNTKLLECYK